MDSDVYDQWLKVWEEAVRVSGASGLTTTELVERWGISDKTVRKRLHWLDAHGLITHGRAIRETLLDELRLSPVYFAVSGVGTGITRIGTGE